MVLSNKKLKQKIRAAKAELIIVAEAKNSLLPKDSVNISDGYSKTSDALTVLQNQEAQRLKLSKREKRKKKAKPDNSELNNQREMGGEVGDKTEDELKSGEMKVKKQKRNRDESNASENGKDNEPKTSKKAKNKRKRKKVETKRIPKEICENNPGQSAEQLVSNTCANGVDRKELESSTKVYVGGIPYYSTEDDIRSYFDSCGSITNVDCMRFQDSEKFRGIAIITFKTEAAAKRALALDGSDMGGLFLKIQPFKSVKASKSSNFAPTVLEGYNRIYVGNLSWDITEDDLRKTFSDCTITSLRFGEDKETGEFKGYAHIDFADSLSLNMALKLDQSVVCGRPIKVSCAVPKKGAVANLKSNPKDDQVNSNKISEVGEDLDTSSSKVGALSRDQETSSSKVGALNQSLEISISKVDALSRSLETSSSKVDALSRDQVRSAANPISSKIRRRTCYECGEKGHLSSSCPKIQATDLESAGAA